MGEVALLRVFSHLLCFGLLAARLACPHGARKGDDDTGRDYFADFACTASLRDKYTMPLTTYNDMSFTSFPALVGRLPLLKSYPRCPC